MISGLNMSHGKKCLILFRLEKMSDFVSFPLFGFTLVIKLRSVDFKGH